MKLKNNLHWPRGLEQVLGSNRKFGGHPRDLDHMWKCQFHLYLGVCDRQDHIRAPYGGYKNHRPMLTLSQNIICLLKILGKIGGGSKPTFLFSHHGTIQNVLKRIMYFDHLSELLRIWFWETPKKIVTSVRVFFRKSKWQTLVGGGQF